MKRKLFIGSSSESVEIAQKVRKAIDEKCNGWLETVLWKDSGVFELNHDTLSCLVKQSRMCDYGVFIGYADDCILTRKSLRKTTRDNVIFELGLFMGALGLSRAFVITSVKLPSDMDGVTTIRYNGSNVPQDKIDQLVEKIEKTKDSYRLGHRQSTALAVGYFNNFLKPTLDMLSSEGFDFKFDVLVPLNISDMPKRIEKYELSANSKVEAINSGPIQIHKRDADGREYWDIPRLLRTLEDLISFIEPRNEPGDNPDYNTLLNIELDNFRNVLAESNKQLELYKENLRILRVNC